MLQRRALHAGFNESAVARYARDAMNQLPLGPMHRRRLREVWRSAGWPCHDLIELDLLADGGVQWMTAGRGVIHSELPEQTEGRMEGFQLWLNLPARDKMSPPWYRDIQSADLPEWRAEGVKARVIAGATHGVVGAVQREATQPLYLDLHLAPGASFEQPLPEPHNAFVYVYRGSLAIGVQPVPVQRMAILANAGDGVRLTADSKGARAILGAGRPLKEPIVQYGPFVMNTQQEIYQAVEDFRAGRLA